MEIIKKNGAKIQIKNRIGMCYGLLTVIEYAGTERHKTRWICKCSCGNVKTIFSDSLRVQKSCGCLLKKGGFKSHGMTKSTYYMAWKHMKDRCYSEKNLQYKDYGGRGIKVCDRWLNSFENFYADMGDKPAPFYTLDRINNDKGYYPENCRWSDRTTQSYNKRNNVFLCDLKTGVFYTILEAHKLKCFNRLARV